MVWLRFRATPVELHIRTLRDPIEFTVVSDFICTVRIEFAPTERPTGEPQQEPMITARMELASGVSHDLLSSISRGVVPADYGPRPGASVTLSPGVSALQLPVETEWMPPEAEREVAQTLGELRRTVESTTHAIRWRLRLRGPTRLFASSASEWSVDEAGWHEFNPGVKVSIEEFLIPPVDADALADIKSRVSEGFIEPVPDALMREAWELRSDYPRSALLIGMSALEAAAKIYISDRAPMTAWLVENLPAPPVNRLITRYVPLLPAAGTIDGVVRAPHREYRQLLDKAVQLRNNVAHTGTAQVEAEEVERILEMVRGLIGLLDLYRGHAWVTIDPAVRYVITAIRREASGKR